AAQEIGDRSPDHPAPADQHIHGFKRSLVTSRPQFSSGHAIGNSLLLRSNDISPPCLQVADPSLYCCAAEARRLHRASPRRARDRRRSAELKFRIQFPPADSPSLSGFGLRPKKEPGFPPFWRRCGAAVSAETRKVQQHGAEDG